MIAAAPLVERERTRQHPAHAKRDEVLEARCVLLREDGERIAGPGGVLGVRRAPDRGAQRTPGSEGIHLSHERGMLLLQFHQAADYGALLAAVEG